MRCIGRTKKLERCKVSCKLLFCPFHRFQIWLLVVGLGVIGGLAQDIINPVINYFNSDGLEVIDINYVEDDNQITNKPILPNGYRVESLIDSSLLKDYSLTVYPTRLEYIKKTPIQNKNSKNKTERTFNDITVSYKYGNLTFYLTNSSFKTLIIKELTLHWEYQACNEINVVVENPRIQPSLIGYRKYACELSKWRDSCILSRDELYFKKGDLDKIDLRLEFSEDYGEYIFWTKIKSQFVGETDFNEYESKIFYKSNCDETIVITVPNNGNRCTTP